MPITGFLGNLLGTQFGAGKNAFANTNYQGSKGNQCCFPGAWCCQTGSSCCTAQGGFSCCG